MVRSLVSLLPIVVILWANVSSASVTFSGTQYNAPGNGGTVSADLNRDGWPDVAVAGDWAGQPVVAVLLATSSGQFGAETNYSLPPNGFSDASNVLAADFNKDGALDLIISRRSAPQLNVLWNNGDGTFRKGPTINLGQKPSSFDLGDFNHDGLLDVATLECNFSYPLACSVNVYLGKGSAIFVKSQVVHLKSAVADHLMVADLNGDSNPDIVISRGTQLVIFWGQSAGTLASPSYLTPKDNDDVESFAIADFNNDGKLDLVIDTGTRLSSFMGCLSGSMWIYKNTGGNKFSLVGSLRGGCSFLHRIDMNGDLNQDLIFENGDPNGGFFGGILGNGDETFRALQSQSFPNQGGGSVYVRDLNLDSRDDYIVADALGGLTVALQTGGFKNCAPPNSAKLAAKICTPATGSTSASPLLVRAAGNSPVGIVQLQVWVDGVKKAVKWHDELAIKLALPSGTHRVAVIATDKYMGTAKSSVTVTVP